MGPINKFFFPFFKGIHPWSVVSPKAMERTISIYIYIYFKFILINSIGIVFGVHWPTRYKKALCFIVVKRINSIGRYRLVVSSTSIK